MAKLVIRTKKEILKEIKEISENDDNFTYDNYSRHGCDNISYDYGKTEQTLKDFVNWLMNKKFIEKGGDKQ